MRKIVPDTVYTDLGDVVFRFKNGLEHLALEYKKPYDQVEKTFRKYDDQVCRGSLTPQDLWEKYLLELELPEKELDFADFWVKHFTPIPETIELLQKLEEAEIPIGIISNIYLGIFELINQKGILPKINWHATILSCDIGIVKPEQKIYQIAEEAMTKPYPDILFIDDRESCLAPAKARGWTTYQFNPENPTHSVAEIEKILELA